MLDADLRRRSPDRYRQVFNIIHRQAIAALRGDDVTSHELWAHQKLYLHRRSPLSAAFWVLRERGSAAVVRGRPADHPEIIDLISAFRRRSGSAGSLPQWLDAQPEGLSVVRSGAGVLGFSLQLQYPTDPALVDADPVVRTVVEAIRDQSPLRPGEQISIAPVSSAAGNNTNATPTRCSAACIGSTLLWMSRPFALSFVATVDPEFWGPCFDYLGLTSRMHTSFDGRDYTIYGIDWRRIPVDLWLEVMAEREFTGEQGPIAIDRQRPAPLTRTGFDEAVRTALRDLGRPDRLRGNMLTGSWLVPGRPATGHRELRSVLTAEICRLADRTANRRPGQGAGSHLRACGPHPGGRGRGARPAVLDLPAAPGEGRRRTDRRPVVHRDRRQQAARRAVTADQHEHRLDIDWAPTGLVGEQPGRPTIDAHRPSRGESWQALSYSAQEWSDFPLRSCWPVTAIGSRCWSGMPPSRRTWRRMPGPTGSEPGSTNSGNCTSCCPVGTRRLRREIPDVIDVLVEAGACQVNVLGVLDPSWTGGQRPGDDRFDTVTARRPVLEAALAAVAARTPGVQIVRGVPVTGLIAEPSSAAGVPEVVGVLARGLAVRADLVVDATGRRSAVPTYIEAIGARRPAERRADAGFVYYATAFPRRVGGRRPSRVARATMLAHFDSVSLLTLPCGQRHLGRRNHRVVP